VIDDHDHDPAPAAAIEDISRHALHPGERSPLDVRLPVASATRPRLSVPSVPRIGSEATSSGITALDHALLSIAVR